MFCDLPQTRDICKSEQLATDGMNVTITKRTYLGNVHREEIFVGEEFRSRAISHSLSHFFLLAIQYLVDCHRLRKSYHVYVSLIDQDRIPLVQKSSLRKRCCVLDFKLKMPIVGMSRGLGGLTSESFMRFDLIHRQGILLNSWA